MTLPPKASPEPRSAHIRPSRSATAGPGSQAYAAPLMAPTEVPTITSGVTPCSANDCNMPTSAAPSIPPPPNTKAVLVIEAHLDVLKSLVLLGFCLVGVGP